MQDAKPIFTDIIMHKNKREQSNIKGVAEKTT